MGPVWEGNQVWLILGGGAIFAAWPPLYAACFSGFYLAMLLVLAALILRPGRLQVSQQDARTRAGATIWDWALFVGGAVPALVFGVAIGNLLQGVPFSFDSELRATYAFGLFDLLNPFAMLCGLVSVAMLSTHGAVYLAMKTDGGLAQRARAISRISALFWVVLFSPAGIWLWRGQFGFAITAGALPGGEPDPLAKAAIAHSGAWLANYLRWPMTSLAPATGLAAPLLVAALARSKRRLTVFIVEWPRHRGRHRLDGSQFISVSAPLLFPSTEQPHRLGCLEQSPHPWHHVGRRDHFLPIVLVYTGWVYHVMRGPVTSTYIEANRETSY